MGFGTSQAEDTLAAGGTISRWQEAIRTHSLGAVVGVSQWTADLEPPALCSAGKISERGTVREAHAT